MRRVLPGSIRCPHCARLIQPPSLKASARYLAAKQLIELTSGKYHDERVLGGTRRWDGTDAPSRWEFMLRARARMTGKKGETGRRKLAEWEAEQAKVEPKAE